MKHVHAYVILFEQRMAFRKHQLQMVVEQCGAAQPGFLDGRGDDARVKLFVAHGGDDFMRFARDQLQLGRRVFFHERGHERRQGRLQGGEAGAERNGNLIVAFVFGDHLHEFELLLPLLQCEVVGGLPESGKLQPFAAPIEQADAQLVLQL